MTAAAYIAAAWRTPFARAGTALADVSAQELATAIVRPALSAVPSLPGLADVILGNVLNGRGNLARYASLAAGFGSSVPGATVDRQCASGMEAIMQAAYRAEHAGSAPTSFVAGGVESMSGAPFLMARPTRAYDRQPPAFIDVPLSPPSLGDPSMIEAAEIVTAEAGVTRAEVDSFALASHQRAVAAGARKNGRDIVSIRSAAGEMVAEDVGPRVDTSLERLARLTPVLSNGTVTAGNASGIQRWGRGRRGDERRSARPVWSPPARSHHRRHLRWCRAGAHGDWSSGRHP